VCRICDNHAVVLAASAKQAGRAGQQVGQSGWRQGLGHPQTMSARHPAPSRDTPDGVAAAFGVNKSHNRVVTHRTEVNLLHILEPRHGRAVPAASIGGANPCRQADSLCHTATSGAGLGLDVDGSPSVAVACSNRRNGASPAVVRRMQWQGLGVTQGGDTSKWRSPAAHVDAQAAVGIFSRLGHHRRHSGCRSSWSICGCDNRAFSATTAHEGAQSASVYQGAARCTHGLVSLTELASHRAPRLAQLRSTLMTPNLGACESLPARALPAAPQWGCVQASWAGVSCHQPVV
jgi:hypothetical protein